MSQQYAAEVVALTKRFGSFTAVDGISFAVREGEIFGFLGPNGAGKTTTIRMLLGLVIPTSGRASVLGYDVVGEARQIRQRTGYMSQRFSLYSELRVVENLDFYGRTYGVRGAELAERKRFVLDMAGLLGRERELTRNLSSGWKQRLALGAAILHRPRILFLDEPTAGVDPISRREFWKLLYELAGEGTTIFVTTHYMDEAEHCNRLAFIHQGRIVAEGTPEQIKQEQMRGQVLEVDCDQPEQALLVLRSMRCFDEVTLYGAQVHAVAAGVEALQPAVAQALAEQDISLYSLAVIPPSLEDVFIARIGKT